MEHQIKLLAEAMNSDRAKHLIRAHVRELHFENNHLIVYVDNTAPLHEFENKKMDEHLKKGMEKIYGENITYEYKLQKADKPHEREKEVGREYNFNMIRGSKRGKK